MWEGKGNFYHLGVKAKIDVKRICSWFLRSLQHILGCIDVEAARSWAVFCACRRKGLSLIHHCIINLFGFCLLRCKWKCFRQCVTSNVGRCWCLWILKIFLDFYFEVFLLSPIPQLAPASDWESFWRALEVWAKSCHWLLCWMPTKLPRQTWMITYWNSLSRQPTQNSLLGRFGVLRKTLSQWDWVAAPQWLLSSPPQYWRPEI